MKKNTWRYHQFTHVYQKLWLDDVRFLRYGARQTDRRTDRKSDILRYVPNIKIKDETRGVVIEEFVGLKPKIYSFLVDSSEHKKAKGVNKNVVTTISHNEYKDILLNNKWIRHSMNRIQSKDHRIGTYKIKKISLSCFDDKIYN